jgi:superfamily II DNA or RNA helicase
LGDFTVTHNTICAINLICRLARKALIVVHKEFLLTQWKERIAEFAPDASIGIIKGKILTIEHKDIVIASLQSLAMKDYDDSVFSSFGTIVIDECHHTGAQVFSQALRKYTFRYSIGLTATPKRKDGLTKVFTWFLGDIAYQTKKRNDELQVIFKDYYHTSPDYCREHLLYTNKPNIARMINSICEFTPRIDFVVDHVKSILAEEPERKLLVLSDRRIHLQLLKDAFEKEGIEAGLYYGGLAPWQLKESEEKQILLGTFNYISEGFDMKGLDTLVLASPKSDVVQIVGRILRDKPEDRKHMPMVLDIIDNFSVFQNQAQKRYTYYKKCGYEILNYTPIVKTVKLTPGKCLI